MNDEWALISLYLYNIQIFLNIFSFYNKNNITEDFHFQPLWNNKNQIFPHTLNNCKMK